MALHVIGQGGCNLTDQDSSSSSTFASFRSAISNLSINHLRYGSGELTISIPPSIDRAGAILRFGEALASTRKANLILLRFDSCCDVLAIGITQMGCDRGFQYGVGGSYK